MFPHVPSWALILNLLFLLFPFHHFIIAMYVFKGRCLLYYLMPARGVSSAFSCMIYNMCYGSRGCGGDLHQGRTISDFIRFLCQVCTFVYFNAFCLSLRLLMPVSKEWDVCISTVYLNLTHPILGSGIFLGWHRVTSMEWDQNQNSHSWIFKLFLLDVDSNLFEQIKKWNSLVFTLFIEYFWIWLGFIFIYLILFVSVRN